MRAARADNNQTAIVNALRAYGASVSVGSAFGRGSPDIAVGFGDRNYFFEIKDPTQPKWNKRLTPDQKKWHAEWKGQVAVIETIEDALRAIKETK
jgi:hypothetical protein